MPRSKSACSGTNHRRRDRRAGGRRAAGTGARCDDGALPHGARRAGRPPPG